MLNAILVMGMLVLMPLGLRLIDGLGSLHRWWWAGALAGAVSLWLPRGWPAGTLATAYGLLTVALAALGAARFIRRRSVRPAAIAVTSALLAPAVAGLSLVAERFGYPLMSFDFETLSLTVAHFHFAGFAAALIAGLVCVSRGSGRLADFAALSVPVGMVIVAIGYFAGDGVELAGAVVLTAGMWSVAWLMWQRTTTSRWPRLAALTLVPTMMLALSWAVGEAFGLPHLSIDWMIATHGVANAFGFALCALLAAPLAAQAR